MSFLKKIFNRQPFPKIKKVEHGSEEEMKLMSKLRQELIEQGKGGSADLIEYAMGRTIAEKAGGKGENKG